jgi:peptide/nickel transport system permease protein
MSAAAGTAPPGALLCWRTFWRRAPLTLRIGAYILLAHLAIAVIGYFWTPYGPATIGTGPPVSGMSWQHPFGVDQLGRDVFSRAMFASHIDILLSLSGALLGLVIGAVLGLLSGYLRGPFDDIVQRLNETLISIPFLVLALIAIAAAGPAWAGNPALVVFVLALVYAPRVSRMARSAAIEIASRDFVTIARLRGEGAWSIMRRELLPNATGVLLVEFALRAGYAPILIGSLGFLGFGMRPPTPEWGLMMSDNRNLLIASPSTMLGPGFMLASLVVGLNLFTEGLARILGRTVRIETA